MKNILIAACTSLAASFALPVMAGADPPTRDQGSELILLCAAGPCGPVVTDYMSDDFFAFSLRPKNSEAVCNAISQNPSGIYGVTDAVEYIESAAGFSYMESIAALIHVVGAYCPENQEQLSNWANASPEYRGM